LVKPHAGPGQALGWAREALGTMGFFGWGFLDRPLRQKTPYPKKPICSLPAIGQPPAFQWPAEVPVFTREVSKF